MIQKTIKPQSSFATISKDDLLGKIERGEPLQIVNVLGPEHYNLGFIKGSKKIPLSELAERLDELDKDKEIIVYCAGYECPASRQAAEKLAFWGFKVKAYEGGIREWKESGFSAE